MRMPASFFKECRTTAEAAALHVVEILYQPLTRPLLTRSFCVVGLTAMLNHNFTFKIPSRCFCLAGIYSAVAPLKNQWQPTRRVISPIDLKNFKKCHRPRPGLSAIHAQCDNAHTISIILVKSPLQRIDT